MSFKRDIPFNDLPLLWPHEKLWKTIPVLEKLNLANKALAELKGHMAAIPNPQIFIQTLFLQEAKESSEIENIFTTNDKLFKAFTTEKTTDRNTKEVLRYGKAITDSFKRLKKENKFSLPFIESIYQIIKNDEDGIRKVQVYVGNAFEIRYTPPSGEDVLHDKLSNWVKKANENSDIDPLINMAFLHYQFEAIHPFKDGNGRTGRILNVLYLCFNNLLDEPILYLSKYINTYKRQYYDALLDVSENDNWENWLLYMLDAIKHTAEFTLKKVKAIENLFEKTRKTIQEKATKVYSYELLEVLFSQVYCKYDFLIQRNIASRNTASDYLNELTKIGILEKEKVGNTFVFKNIALYELFSEN
jgi:Fic family protein